MKTRRKFVLGAVGGLIAAILGYFTLRPGKGKAAYEFNGDLQIWLSGDAHLKQSIDVLQYDCLREAIADMDNIGFDYDLALNVGDFDSAQQPPTNDSNAEEGELVAAALSSSPNHERADYYCINGNHDAGDGQMEWFERYIDILGEQPEFSKHDISKRRYPITVMEEGAWHSYYVEVGNLIVFMLSDRNALPGPFGRGGLVQGKGGYPSGTISKKTWSWLQQNILANKDKNIFVCTHHGVRNTVIATGDDEGYFYHSAKTGFSEGRGCLYTIYDEDNPDASINGSDVIKEFLADNPDHSVRLWMSGHTHTRVGTTWQGRGIRHREHNVEFLNVCSLTTSWVSPKIGHVDSRSWTCEIIENRARLRCFVHRPVQEHIQKGFQDDLEFTVELAHPFQA